MFFAKFKVRLQRISRGMARYFKYFLQILAFLVFIPTFSVPKSVHLLIWFKPTGQFLYQTFVAFQSLFGVKNKRFVFTFEVRLAIIFSNTLTEHKSSFPLFGVNHLLSAKFCSSYWVIFPKIQLHMMLLHSHARSTLQLQFGKIFFANLRGIYFSTLVKAAELFFLFSVNGWSYFFLVVRALQTL